MAHCLSTGFYSPRLDGSDVCIEFRKGFVARGIRTVELCSTSNMARFSA